MAVIYTSVYRNTAALAQAISHRISKVGIGVKTVWINYFDTFDAAIPFDGYKMSGQGRKKGKLQSKRIKAMSCRPINPIARHFAENAVTPSSSPSHQKARSSPILSLGLVILGAFLLLGYSYSGSGSANKGYSKEDRNREALSNEEDISCGSEVIKALPILQEVYGESAHKVLHVGPESCAVTSRLLKEEDIEAWGIDPFDIIPPLDHSCKSLIREGIVRVADIKFPLPYKAQSFSIVLVSDAPDKLSPKYLNKTLPDLARVSIDGFVMFVGQPGHRSSTKIAQIIQQRKGRN